MYKNKRRYKKNYKKGYQLSRRLKRLENQVSGERKFVDVNTSTTVDAVGFISYISAIAIGDDTTDREGRQIKPLYYHCNCDFQMNASATRTFLRMILFQDTECQGATPAVTDVITANAVNAQYNLLTGKGRFKFLMDKLFAFDSANIAKVDKSSCKVPLKIMFDGTGATSASAGKNALFCLFISDQVTNTPQVNVRHRLRFVDN